MLQDQKYSTLINEILDAIPLGISVYSPEERGEDFIFAGFNREAERITRVNRENVLGRRLLECFPNMDKTPLPKTLAQVYQTGETHVLPPFYYEDSLRHGFRKNTLFKLSSGHVVAAFSDTTEEEVLRFFLDTLFNIEKNLLFTTIRGEELDECNPVLLSFLGFDSLADFKRTHRCVCEFFIEEEAKGYIGTDSGD